MTGFRCLAERCPDSCCRGMDIAVDRPTYERWGRASEAGGVEAYLDVHRLTVLNPDPHGPDDHAWLRRDADGACVCLDVGGLCRLQGAHGDQLLGDTCALYPRMAERTEAGLELMGSLSCPEAARLCLTDEGALDRVEISAGAIPRLDGSRLGALLARGPADSQRRIRERIRAFAEGALGDESFPLETRLCWLVHLGDRLGRLLPPADDRPGDEAEALVGEELAQLARPEERAALHAWRLRKELPAGPAIGLLLSIQQALSDGTQSARLARAILTGFETFGGGSPEAMAGVYQLRRQRLHALFGQQIDRYFARYSINAWMTDFLASCTRLPAYVLGWLSRLGHLRLFLAGHPLLTPVLEAGVDDAAARNTVEEAACAATQLLVKEIEHRPVIRAATESAAGAVETGDLFGRSLLFVNV